MTPPDPTPTPWVEKYEFLAVDPDSDPDTKVVFSERARTLERHLRRIVEDGQKLINALGAEALSLIGVYKAEALHNEAGSLRQAIAAAKEELNK